MYVLRTYVYIQFAVGSLLVDTPSTDVLVFLLVGLRLHHPMQVLVLVLVLVQALASPFPSPKPIDPRILHFPFPFPFPSIPPIPPPSFSSQSGPEEKSQA